MASIVEGGFLKGKKTYITVGLAILGAIGTWSIGEISAVEAIAGILAALGVGGLRDGIKSEVKAVIKGE